MIHFNNTMEIQRIFVDNVKYYRDKKGLSQAKLAELCRLSNGMIGKIESFSASPSLKTIGRICNALEVNPEQLFRDRSDPASYHDPFMEEFASEIRQVLSQYTGEEKRT